MSHMDEIFSSDERCSSAEKVSSAENFSSAEKFSSDEFGRNRRAFFEVWTDERTPKRFRPVSASDEPKWTNRIRSPGFGDRQRLPFNCVLAVFRPRHVLDFYPEFSTRNPDFGTSAGWDTPRYSEISFASLF